MYSGSRVGGLEVTYLTEKSGEQTVMHGDRCCLASEIDLKDAALKDIFFRNGRVVDQISFRDTRGRFYGPFGGNGGSPREIRANEGEAIIAFFGRSGRAIDQLGAVFQKGAIERVELTGSFQFTPISSAISPQLFSDDNAVLSLPNCDPDGTTSLFGEIAFSESVSTSESFSLSTTQQSSFETSISAGVTVKAFRAEFSASITVTVGNSFEETEEFGQEFTSEKGFAFSTQFEAEPGQEVIATALFSKVDYAFKFQVPVNVFFVADPTTAVPQIYEGVLEGVTASQGIVTLDVAQCL